MALKDKLMEGMMNKYFNNMSSEEKSEMMDTMMDKFFNGMSDEEKKQMMADMMPKMMGGSENPMMGMMGMMMGKKRGDKENMKMPWDRCGDMMENFSETASSAKFATQELRALFDEWCEQIEKEMLDSIKKEGKTDIKKLSTELHLSEESIKYLLGNLAKKEKLAYQPIV